MTTRRHPDPIQFDGFWFEPDDIDATIASLTLPDLDEATMQALTCKDINISDELELQKFDMSFLDKEQGCVCPICGDVHAKTTT